MKTAFICTLLGFALSLSAATAPSSARFRAVEVDNSVQIGYGITVADVDGDKKPDLVLADKNLFVWYQNPTWKKHVLAEKVTALDHVCIAARDVDGDGKAEIAVGAGWNPGDTVGSGSLHYLVPPADRTTKWTLSQLHHEPTIHRIRWIKTTASRFDLVSVPLHGRGNRNAQGDGVKILAYKMPRNPGDKWETELIADHIHQTHNFDPVDWDGNGTEEFLCAAKEGVFLFKRGQEKWQWEHLSSAESGEVRQGKLPGGQRYFATVEPFHGTNIAIYTPPQAYTAKILWDRNVIDPTLKGAHALGCGDFTKSGHDQLVAGWRDKNADGKVGLKLYSPRGPDGKQWDQTLVDDDGMACEDLAVADLNGDGWLDIVAAGRATKNLKVYFNETGAK